MFDIGFSELVIVAVVALIVLGPERLPSALRAAGLWAGRIRRTIGNVQKEISEELRVEEMRRAAKEQQERLEKQVGEMKRPFSDTLRDEILSPTKRADEAPDTPASAAEPPKDRSAAE